MPFHVNIKALREDYEPRLSQEKLAKAFSTTQRRISHLERGEIEPAPEDICKYCIFFNVSADYLLDLPKGLPYPK